MAKKKKASQNKAVSKQTSARWAGKGLKLLSSTRDQLIKDLQRVHKLFPNAEPDRDFYRAHGKYADAGWKEHFPRFKDFVAEAGVTPAAAVCWHLNQAFKLLQRDFSEPEARKIDAAFNRVYAVLPPLDEESERAVMEVLAKMEEKERLEAEENEKRQQTDTER